MAHLGSGFHSTVVHWPRGGQPLSHPWSDSDSRLLVMRWFFPTKRISGFLVAPPQKIVLAKRSQVLNMQGWVAELCFFSSTESRNRIEPLCEIQSVWEVKTTMAHLPHLPVTSASCSFADHECVSVVNELALCVNPCRLSPKFDWQSWLTYAYLLSFGRTQPLNLRVNWAAFSCCSGFRAQLQQVGRPDVWFPPPQTVFLMLERLAVHHCHLILCSRLGGVQRNVLSENVDAFKGGTAQQMHAWVRKEYEYSFLSLSVCSHHSPCSMVFRQGPSRASHCPAELGKSSPSLDPDWRRIHHFRSFKEIASGIAPLAYPNERKSRLHSDSARVAFPGG